MRNAHRVSAVGNNAELRIELAARKRNGGGSGGWWESGKMSQNIITL